MSIVSRRRDVNVEQEAWTSLGRTVGRVNFRCLVGNPATNKDALDQVWIGKAGNGLVSCLS